MDQKEGFVNDLITECFEQNKVVGGAVCLISEGETKYVTYGKKSVGGDPVTEETIFEIGAITKLFTTLALMDSMRKNEVGLDDPIQKYLPGVNAPEYNGQKIAFRHLATHTSGLPQLPDNFNPQNPNNQYADYTLEQLYQFLNRHTLARTPGTTLVYSNMGIGILGHLLSLRAGKSYEEMIVKLLSENLGMKDTFITVTPEREPHMSMGHAKEVMVERWKMGALHGESAFRSTIKDMGKFLAANMGVLLTPVNDLLKECHKAQYKTENITTGLGWILSNGILMHNGGTGGFRSFIGFHPERQKGVVVLANTREEWIDDLGKSLIDSNYRKPLVNRELAHDLDYLKQFVGNYEVSFPNGSPKQEMKITVSDVHLALSFKNGSTGLLYPERFGHFGIRGFAEAKIQFSFGLDGRVVEVRAVHSNGKVLWEAVAQLTV